MNTLTKNLCAGTLGLMLLFVAASSANAQSFGGRLSTGQKAGAIGGGAAAGAVIGGLLGGKKGAIIGGALGAAGGTAFVYSQGRDDRYRRDSRYRNNWNDRRWEGNRFDNDRGRDHDRDDRRNERGRSGYNRFRH